MAELTDVPLFIVQGEKLDLVILIQEEDTGAVINITDWTARFSIKRNFSDTTFAADITDVANAQGQITITGVEGKVHIFIKGAHTQTLAPGKYRYNCFLYDLDGEPDDILHGTLTIQDSVL